MPSGGGWRLSSFDRARTLQVTLFFASRTLSRIHPTSHTLFGQTWRASALELVCSASAYICARRNLKGSHLPSSSPLPQRQERRGGGGEEEENIGARLLTSAKRYDVCSPSVPCRVMPRRARLCCGCTRAREFLTGQLSLGQPPDLREPVCANFKDWILLFLVERCFPLLRPAFLLPWYIESSSSRSERR